MWNQTMYSMTFFVLWQNKFHRISLQSKLIPNHHSTEALASAPRFWQLKALPVTVLKLQMGRSHQQQQRRMQTNLEIYSLNHLKEHNQADEMLSAEEQ